MLGLRTWADWRAFLHVLLPAVATAAVGSGLLLENHAALWVALGTALLDPLLSITHSDGFRQALYGVALAANAVLIGVFGLWTEAQSAPWFALIPILISGGVAAANTPTTIDSDARPVTPAA